MKSCNYFPILLKFIPTVQSILKFVRIQESRKNLGTRQRKSRIVLRDFTGRSFGLFKVEVGSLHGKLAWRFRMEACQVDTAHYAY